MVEAIISQDAVDNATSYGSLEKARTMIKQLHVDGAKEVDNTIHFTPQNEHGYIGLDAPLN